ncbi:MAG: hypothetical protein ACREX8_04220 [Gammaproteobacteria bacterium]
MTVPDFVGYGVPPPLHQYICWLYVPVVLRPNEPYAMYFVCPGFTTVEDVLVVLTVMVWVIVVEVLELIPKLTIPRFSPPVNVVVVVYVEVNVVLTVMDSVHVTGSELRFVNCLTLPYGWKDSPLLLPNMYQWS